MSKSRGLSWVLEERDPKPEARDQKQTAYQILVASTPELLAKDQGDLWDSGKVASDQSAQIEYAGKAAGQPPAVFLESGRVAGPARRQNPRPAWSKPAMWEMGLLKPGDWKAKWIEGTGYVAKKPPTAPASLAILSATYGSDAAKTDVTSLLSGMVKNHCLSVKADNAVFGGDPSFGKVKQLIVEYELGGKRLKKTVEEGSMLSIPDDFRVRGFR